MENGITIEMMDARIAAHPFDEALYIQRGKLYYAANEFGKAMNDFMKAKEIDPSSVEADQYLKMINEILSFYSKDQFNP